MRRVALFDEPEPSQETPRFEDVWRFYRDREDEWFGSAEDWLHLVEHADRYDALYETDPDAAEAYAWGIIESMFRIRYDDAVSRLDAVVGAPVWRTIRIDAGLDAERVDPLGIYWTLDEYSAEVLSTRPRGDVDVRYRGVVMPSTRIDRSGTIHENLDPWHGEEEAEIRLMPGSPIFVLDAEYVDTGRIVSIRDWRRA